MSILPAIPVLLLGAFFVWFVWPVVVDPLVSRIARHHGRAERDRLAEHLFERWSRDAALLDGDRN